MDWTECGSSGIDPSLVTASGGDQKDKGQLEWPQSPSDVQPHRWQCPQERQQYTVDQNDGRLNSMRGIYYLTSIKPLKGVFLRTIFVV